MSKHDKGAIDAPPASAPSERPDEAFTLRAPGREGDPAGAATTPTPSSQGPDVDVVIDILGAVRDLRSYVVPELLARVCEDRSDVKRIDAGDAALQVMGRLSSIAVHLEGVFHPPSPHAPDSRAAVLAADRASKGELVELINQRIDEGGALNRQVAHGMYDDLIDKDDRAFVASIVEQGVEAVAGLSRMIMLAEGTNEPERQALLTRLVGAKALLDDALRA